jgi:hypothetical protein
MDAARVFVSMAADLRVPPSPGLAEQVRAAMHDRAPGRWVLSLTDEQIDSLSYGLWLHGVTRSAAEANRSGREYGIVYQPVRIDAPRREQSSCSAS